MNKYENHSNTPRCGGQRISLTLSVKQWNYNGYVLSPETWPYGCAPPSNFGRSRNNDGLTGFSTGFGKKEIHERFHTKISTVVGDKTDKLFNAFTFMPTKKTCKVPCVRLADVLSGAIFSIHELLTVRTAAMPLVGKWRSTYRRREPRERAWVLNRCKDCVHLEFVEAWRAEPRREKWFRLLQAKRGCEWSCGDPQQLLGAYGVSFRTKGEWMY